MGGGGREDQEALAIVGVHGVESPHVQVRRFLPGRLRSRAGCRLLRPSGRRGDLVGQRLAVDDRGEQGAEQPVALMLAADLELGQDGTVALVDRGTGRGAGGL